MTVPHTWGARATWRTRLVPPALRSVAADRTGAASTSSSKAPPPIADVYVNGRHLGQHRGAYTRFLFDATPHVRAGENVLAVRVSNHPQDTADSLPSGRGKQLYRLYGGLYRKAWLVQAAGRPRRPHRPRCLGRLPHPHAR